MTLNDFLAGSVAGSIGMLSQTLSDFSDADVMVRPVPNANHTIWQLGHLVFAAHMMLAGSGVPLAPLPAGFAEKYTNDTSKSDDPAKFHTKAELLALLTQITQAAATWARTLPLEDFSKPAPERIRAFCPTVGDVLNLQGVHFAMHMGQIQVIRRKLGKPVVF